LVQFISLGAGQLDPAPDVVDIIAKDLTLVDDIHELFGLHAASPVFGL
jgi:hypothetical protein